MYIHIHICIYIERDIERERCTTIITISYYTMISYYILPPPVALAAARKLAGQVLPKGAQQLNSK